MTLARTILPAILLASAAALPASAETRSYSQTGFTEVDSSAGVTVILKQGPFAISAEEPRGRFDKLRIETKGSKLIVSRESFSSWLSRGPDFTVTVTAPSLKAVSASSGSELEGEGLKFADLEVEVSSGANVELSGTCASISISASSGANFDGEDLKCENATVDASSGANVDVWASKTATGDASSGADVNVHGGAAITKDTSSGGSFSAS